MPLDSILLMSPQGALAAKEVTPEGSRAPAQVELYRAVQVELGGFADLARTLGTLVGQPAWFAVRGTPTGAYPLERMPRSHKTDYRGGPSLATAAHHWLLIDLDEYQADLDPATFAADPARYARAARAALPAAFADASMFWAATGSAGVKPGARLRLGFWLSRPLGDSEIKKWIKSWAIPVDTHLYSPSQPHYTAAPVFLDGAADPVPAGLRWGVVEGSTDTVEVSGAAGDETRSKAREDLARACKAVGKAAEGERRDTMNRAAYRLARTYADDELSEAEIRSELVAAGYDAGWTPDTAAPVLDSAIRDGRLAHEEEYAGWREVLARDSEGEVRSTQANVTTYLEHHEAFKGRFAYAVRTGGEVWVRSPDWEHRERGASVSQGDVAKIVEWFSERAGLDAKEAWIRSGVTKAAVASYDPVQDYLEALEARPDVELVSTFFVRHFGVADTRLTRAQTLIWFVQAYRRAYATSAEPVKADYMVLLIGDQGMRKSSVLEALCPVPGAFVAALPDLGSKDALALVAGAWIVELAEFTQSKADRDQFKAFTTRTTDKFRPAYGREDKLFPRRCVIAITTNEGEPLRDPTGNRRFWPMVCTRQADASAVKAERDALWSAVKAAAQTGLRCYLPPELEREAAEVQGEHREENPLADAFRSARVPAFSSATWEPGQVENGVLKWLRTSQACAMVGVRSDNGRGVTGVKEALRDAGWRERRVEARRAWYPPANASVVSAVVN